MDSIDFIYNDDGHLNLPVIPCTDETPNKLSNDLINNDTYFSIFNMNIRSCRQNFASLISFLNSYLLSFSLLVLCETWLTEESDYGFNIPGYKQLNIYRNNFGGGIKIYYKDIFEVEVVEDLTFLNNILEIITFYISGRNFKYLISAIYRPPSTNENDFNNFLLENILHLNFKTIIIGDINLNLFNPRKLNFIDNFVNILYSFSFFQLLRDQLNIIMVIL